MKKLIAAVSLATLLVACSTVYSSIVTITSVVDSASKEYAHEFNLGRVPAEIDVKVEKAHAQYRASAAIAQTALKSYKSSGSGDDYIKALEATRSAADGLLDLISPFLSSEKVAQHKADLKKANKL